MTGDWEMADSRIVISSVSEKSLSFAVRSTMVENPKRETCYSQTFGHRPIYTRGEAVTFIPHSSNAFIHNQWTSRPTG